MEFNIADQTCIIFPDPDPRAVSADPDSDHLLDKIFFYFWNFVLLVGPFCFEKNLKCFVSRVGKNPGFFKKTQPSGFFWVFFGFFGFFWVFLGFFAQTRGFLGFLGFFSVSRILSGASRL